MWDYYQEKLLKSMVLQYEFDFQKISEFFIKKTKNPLFTPKECREQYSIIYKGKKIKSPLSNFFMEKNKKEEMLVNKDNFKEFKENLEKEEKIQKTHFENLKKKKNEKKFFTNKYFEEKKKKEEKFFKEFSDENLDKNIKEKNFTYFFLDREKNNLKINKAEIFSEEGKELRNKLLSSIKTFSGSLNQSFELKKTNKVNSKFSLYSDINIENEIKYDFDV